VSDVEPDQGQRDQGPLRDSGPGDQAILHRLRGRIGGEIANDAAFVMLGHLPATSLLYSIGVEIYSGLELPVHNPRTMETDILGIFIAGLTPPDDRIT
jgi:thioredoxin reductase